MTRAILLVLDSVGIGGAPDADDYGDIGADTIGHIAAACQRGECDNDQRRGPLNLPVLSQLGLGLAAAGSRSGGIPPGLAPSGVVTGHYAHAVEQSRGKDTPSGHWELAGVPVTEEWGYFPATVPSFPRALTEAMIQQGELVGILGNCHASGTTVLADLGEESLRSGKPIVYTSADSVIQIAAHEEVFGLARLYQLCEITRQLVDDYRIGRVIARPFVGHSKADFRRTAHRRDYATPPPGETLLDRAVAAGRQVLTVGKVGDIFAHRGISEVVKAADNPALFQATLDTVERCPAGGMVFTNFVDFDSVFGHRRDVAGYAGALEAFDRQLPTLLARLQPGDLLVITADHGNDPTWGGTDHTREQVPVLLVGPGIVAGDSGERSSFADVGQTLAHHLGLSPLSHGKALPGILH